ncbi:unnamed protein product [Hydatigera taeniaeformis]|uniref:Non-specific serine/threonine protein kinase n=1 Tax=Hydatigena taeniaeformis TaxID=6205 RepID=A0A0R3X623_HYDTA|nr:unnamed protein product [Hydatigera taeniaeformis]
MISIVLKEIGKERNDEIRKDPSLPIRLWKSLVNRVSLKNAELSLKNCNLLLIHLNEMGVSLKSDVVLNDLSSTIFAMGIDGSAGMSDEAWISLINLIEKSLLLSPFASRGNKVRLRAISSVGVLLKCFNKEPKNISTYERAVRASYVSKILPGFSQALLVAVVGEKGRNSVVKAPIALDECTLVKLQLVDYSSFVESSITPLGRLLKRCSMSILSEPVTYNPSAKDRLCLALSDFSSDILRGCWRFLNLSLDAQSARDHILSSLIVVDVDESCSSFKRASDVLSELSKRDFPVLASQEVSGLNFSSLPGREVVDDTARQILLNGLKVLTKSLQKCSGLKGITRFIENEGNLQSFLKVLCRYLEIDPDTVCLVDEVYSLPTDTFPSVQLFRKYFVHFRNPANLYRVLDMVRLLTCSCKLFKLLMKIGVNFDCVSQMLVRLLESESDLEAPSLLLLSASLSGLSCCDDQPRSERISLVAALIDQLSERNLLQLHSETNQTAIVQWPPTEKPLLEATPTNTTREQKVRCLKACIFMELLTTASTVWRSPVEECATYPDEMQPFILQMFGLATGAGLIASTSQRALSSISTNCGYLRFEEFTCAAAEPILSSLTIDFHSVLLSIPSDNSTFSTSPLFKKLETACRALSYLVENTTFEAIQRVQPAVMQMLICMDQSYEFAASVFLPVLRKIIGFCLRPTPNEELSDDAKRIPSISTSSANGSEVSYIEKLRNRRNDKSVIASCMKKTLEMTSALVNLTRRQHSYAFAEPSYVDETVDSPTTFDEHDTHDAEHEKPIARPTQAFELFATLTSAAGTFIRSRATTDLIGSLVTFLDRGASFSAGATSSFECLTACRVQKRLLYALGPICVQVHIFCD